MFDWDQRSLLILSQKAKKHITFAFVIHLSQCFHFRGHQQTIAGTVISSHPVWGQAVFPRSGKCVFWPAAGSWAELGPRRRGGGLSGSPAASTQEESPALGQNKTGKDKLHYNLFKKIDL